MTSNPADLARTYLQPGTLVVAGVSGGPDSLAMLHFLNTLNYPLLIASFNHQLRPEAEADLNFVHQFASELGLPFVSGSFDVATHATDGGLSIEEAARELRYHFLFREARKAGAQAVVVGHTADDQAETVLMHFLRGAGIHGLKGMPPRVILSVFDPEIPLVRPLLNWSRLDTENYCHQHNLKPRIDSTNTDTNYFRNSLRYELLPLLEQYNPQIRQTLAKTALTLQGDQELLNNIIETAWQKTVRASGEKFVEFDYAELEKLGHNLSRNLFRKAAFILRPGLRDVDFDALERAATLKPIDLAGGLKTYREGNRLYLTVNVTSLPLDTWPQIRMELTLTPGHFPLENGWVLSCEEIKIGDIFAGARQNIDRYAAWLDADTISDRLWVRPTCPGDRFEPLGMPNQTVKLAELFINLKVPKRMRRNWPVVIVGKKIAWVPGLRMAEQFKVTQKTHSALKITLKKGVGQV